MKTKIIKIFKKIGAVIVLVSIIIISVVQFNPTNNHNTTPIVNIRAKSEANHQILTKEMVVEKLKSHSQVVSMEQKFSKTYTDYDDGLLGDRETVLNLSGKYKFGFEVSDVEVKHVDADGVIYIKMPKPKMISLEIPFDKINVSKESGFLRFKMNDDEEKEFYKNIKKDVINDIQKNKDTIETINLHNERVIKDILINIGGVKYIVFE